MPNPPFLCRFIDSAGELSVADGDPLALLLAEKSRRDVSLNSEGHSDKYAAGVMPLW